MSRRRIVAWICAVALAAVALGAPLHALAHAAQAASGSNVERDPGAAALAHACEQCLQFAALDGGLATAPLSLPRAAAAQTLCVVPFVRVARPTPFQAFGARAPPRLG